VGRALISSVERLTVTESDSTFATAPIGTVLRGDPRGAALEHEVRDLIVVIDEESVHVARVLAVGRDHAARAPNLDFALRNAVVGECDVLPEIADILAESRGLVSRALVVRESKDVLDADVPLVVADRNLAHS
jgi:hypothetical protein